MYIKREIKKLSKYAVILALGIIAVTYVIFDTNTTLDDGKDQGIVMQQACNASLDLLTAFVKAKSELEIELNTTNSDVKLRDKIKKWDVFFDAKIKELYKYIALNISGNKELKFLKQSLNTFSDNAQKSMDKISKDIARDTRILDLDNWSVFAHKTIQQFLNDIHLVINQNHYSQIAFNINEILINIYSEYVMHNVMMHKKIKDYLVVLTANTSDTIDNAFRKINGIISINRIKDSDVIENITNLSKINSAFRSKITSDDPISQENFGKIVDSIKAQIKFLTLKENALLRNTQEEKDNTNALLLSLGIFAMVTVLLLCIGRYLFYFRRFSNLTKEDIAKENYSNLGFIANIITVSREYLENFVYTKENIEVSNIIPITAINAIKNDSHVEDLSNKAFDDICTIVREINLCNAKIFENLRFLKEKANSLNLKREKLCEIANFNLSEDIHEEMKKCRQEIEGFYKLDSFEFASDITASEFSYLFEKFHELSFKSDNVKNIFLELVSEIKLLTLNSAMSGNDMNAVHAKLNDIISNVLRKVETVKLFTAEANRTYSKTNALLSNLVKVANSIEKIHSRLDEKVSVTRKSIDKFLNHFKTICTHYELILGNSNIEKNELSNFLKVLGNTKIQIENTNTKVNNIISNVERQANGLDIQKKDIG